MEVFHFQRAYNPLYRQFLDALGSSFHEPTRLSEIPCLPISAFKYHAIQTLQWEPVVEFSSSGTTGTQTSRHLLRSLEGYVSNARRGFEGFYGPVSGYCVLALLPSYLERSGSSLVYMAQDFIRSEETRLNSSHEIPSRMPSSA